MYRVAQGTSPNRAINVAFWGSLDWMGGVSYFSNLINALDLYCSETIAPVLILRPFEKNNITDELSTVKQIILPRDDITKTEARAALINEYARSHSIDLISHSPPLNDLVDIPTLGWIPDFQHLRLSNMFSQEEVSERNANFKDTIRYSTRVILSSEAAKQDLLNFMAPIKKPIDILRFRSNIFLQTPAPWPEVSAKYQIEGPYLFLPNQFWQHKNHEDVFRAVDNLNRRGLKVMIFCSGDKTDYRNPRHHSTLLNFIKTRNLGANIRILGRVPRGEFVALMRKALAVIQPSSFEGWSTTVEEARALGKTLILSDIPVHREQNPANALWFALGDYERLAGLIQDLWLAVHHTSSETVTSDSSSVAAIEYHNYAKAYELIVHRALGK